MSLKSLLIVAAALGGFAYAGSACCGGDVAKTEEATPAPAVKAALAVVATPKAQAAQPAAETKAEEAVTVVAAAACETACATAKECGSCDEAKCEKPACEGKASAAEGDNKACADGCGCKG